MGRVCRACGKGFAGRRAAHSCAYHPTDRERFAMKVVCDIATRCWIWTGATCGSPRAPRGWFWVDGSGTEATRYAWEQAHGQPATAMVLHKPSCSSAMCVRPSHLYEGDQFDNMRDRKEAGRYAKRS